MKINLVIADMNKHIDRYSSSLSLASWLLREAILVD